MSGATGMDEQQKLNDAKAQMLATKATLDDPTYIAGLTQDQQDDAIVKSASLSTAIEKIENTQIAVIADKVSANSAELQKATADLAAANAQIQNATALLNAAGSLLSIVGRIVAL